MGLPYARSAVPSSCVVSTARDQATLLLARIGRPPTGGPTASALTASLEPLARADRWSEYASGWFVHPFWPSQAPGSPPNEPGVPLMYEHGGTAVTYRSFLAFAPGAHYGIVVLANRDDEITPSRFNVFTDQLTRTALGTPFPPYQVDEDLIRRYSPGLLIGLPLLQLATLLLLTRSRPGALFTSSVVAATVVSTTSLWILLGYVPAQSTLPLIATWQTLPDVATVTGVCLALTGLMAAALSLRFRHHGLAAFHPRHSTYHPRTT